MDRLYPQLNEAFGALVPLQMKEKEFWEEFVKFQDIHETEVTGGLNPMKLPQKFLDVLEYPFEESKDQQTVEDKGLRSKDLELLLDNEGEKLRTGYGTENPNQVMELDQVLSLDARENAATETKAERLMRTVNTKSEKILKEAEAMEEKTLVEDELMIEEKEEEPLAPIVKTKKEKLEFLSDEAVQENHRIWLNFSKLVQKLTELKDEKETKRMKPERVMEVVEEMTERAEEEKLPVVPDGVERMLKKHQKSVNNLLRLFYASFPIPKKQKAQKLKSLKKLSEELENLENFLQLEMTKPNVVKFKGLFQNMFSQIQKAKTVYSRVMRN